VVIHSNTTETKIIYYYYNYYYYYYFICKPAVVGLLFLYTVNYKMLFVELN